MTNKTSTIDNVPGEGDVPLVLDGKDVVLRPSLQACLGISRLHNSMQITLDKVLSMDMDTIVSIIALGLGQNPNAKLQAAVYRTGLFGIRLHIVKFINIINNGGKAVRDLEDEGDEDDNENPTEAGQIL